MRTELLRSAAPAFGNDPLIASRTRAVRIASASRTLVEHPVADHLNDSRPIRPVWIKSLRDENCICERVGSLGRLRQKAVPIVWWKAVAVLDAEFFEGCLNARCWLRAHGRSVNRGLRESSGMTP